MWAIIKKEFKSIFLSPIGYIVLAIFLIIFSSFFYFYTTTTRSVDLSTVYYAVALYGLPIITSLLTMKSFSEERNKGTEDLLFMSPRSISSIVMGKFISIFFVICVEVMFSLMYYLILLSFGTPNICVLILTIIGFLLLSAAYISFGILISSLTENQVISAIITLVFLTLPLFVPYGNGILSNLSIIDFYTKMPLGIISISEIIGLLSFTITCIALTIIGIKKRRT